MWKWILGLFLAAVVVCGGGGYFVAKSPQFKEMRAKYGGQKKGTEVRLEPAVKGNLIRSISAPGTIEAKTNVKISAQVSARITALPFREGDDVKKDDIVARLDSRDLQASLESTQAQKQSEEARLTGAQAALALAKTEVERQRKLAETRDVAVSSLQAAETDFLRAQSTLEVAQHSIEIADANIRRAQRDLENSTILAPMDGTITKLNSEVGEQVLGTFNNAGTVMMEIADLSVMVLKARVDESNCTGVKPAQNARVYINAYADRVFTGTVERVGLQRQIDRDNTSFIEVEILVQTSAGERLKTGLTANTDIEVETYYDVVKVPSQAVVDRRVDELPKELADSQYIDKNRPFARVVFKVADGKAVATPVSVGPSDLTHSVILGGLDAGDQIVAGPFKVLVDIKHGKEVVEMGTAPKEGEKGTKKPDGGKAAAGGSGSRG